MNIPVRLEGNSPGVRNCGRLLFRKRKLAIKALPDKLPDFFNVDISKLKIGETIIVESLLNDDFTILHPDSTTVVQVKMARAAVAVDEDEEEGEGEEGEEGTAEEGAGEDTAQELPYVILPVNKKHPDTGIGMLLYFYSLNKT